MIRLDVLVPPEAVSSTVKIQGRRDGDFVECWADPSLAELELGWKARRGLEDMLADTWRWQTANPWGYGN